MTNNDQYYRQRIDGELAAADSASDMAIARIHTEMAQLYRDMLRTVSPQPMRSNAEPGTVYI